MFELLAKYWIGFTIGSIIYAGVRYLLVKSPGDTFAIWWGATSMVLLILLVDYLQKKRNDLSGGYGQKKKDAETLV